jgi:hypothetical protein
LSRVKNLTNSKILNCKNRTKFLKRIANNDWEIARLTAKKYFSSSLYGFIYMRPGLILINLEMRADRANSALWKGCELLIFRKIQDEVYPAS